MKKIRIVFIVALIVGCSSFSIQKAEFVAYNLSNDPVSFFVNDGEGHGVAAQSSTRFIAEIQVPRNRVDSYGGPSVIDKTVDVSIAAKNLRTGVLTRPTMCQSGAKVIVHLVYDPKYGYVTCQASYTY